jgi:molybdenum cofactor synthesis domain-containing protein
MGAEKQVNAALVVIGNEVLSGRTRDANTQFIGENLNNLGVRLAEVRIVPDSCDTIVEAVNALRARNDYVFTTGGIGPTHDDITAQCVAEAFGVALVAHKDAVALLNRHYGPERFNDARKRMAYVPEGATLIDNPVSAAPGFQIENVFVMAGIPRIMQAMFKSIAHRLSGGKPMLSKTIATNLGEGVLAGALGQLQEDFGDVEIGSYPSTAQGRMGVRLVLRSTDPETLALAGEACRTIVLALGGEARELDYTA